MVANGWMVLALAGAQLVEIPMPRIMELTGSVLKSSVESTVSKLPEKMVRTGRLSVPMPALLLYFNESGCLTAMVGQQEMDEADWNCLEAESVPTLADFLGSGRPADTPAVIVLSPLYNLDALRSVGSDRDQFWAEQRAELDALQVQLRQAYPQASLYPVYVPFGL